MRDALSHNYRPTQQTYCRRQQVCNRTTQRRHCTVYRSCTTYSLLKLHNAIHILAEFAFSAWTLLVGRQEEHLVCKHLSNGCWRGYLSGARCKYFAYGPADATAIPSSLAPAKSRLVLPFWCRLTQIVLQKRPLSGCPVYLKS